MKVYDNQHTTKDEWEKVKNQPLKVRLQWLWDYYGIIAIVVLAALLICINLVYTIIDGSIPNVIQIEIYSEEVDQDRNDGFKESMCEVMGLDPEEYHIDVSSCTITTTQYDTYNSQSLRLAARVAANDLDILIGTAKTFNEYFVTDENAESYLTSLDTVLPENLMEKLKEQDLIYYLEDNKGNQIPVAIDIQGSKFYEYYGLVSKQAYAGISNTAPHIESIIAFIENFVLK